TGSHNPADNNGFKIALGKATIYGDEIQAIAEIMEQGRRIDGKGSARVYDIMPEYIDDIVSRIHRCDRRLTVVIDPGNGVGGPAAMAVCNALGMDVHGICLEPDGNFPNHHPDPTTVEGLAMLRAEVLSRGADLGIGLDGDADRIGVIDARGDTVYGDIITAILAADILKDRPGEKIIGEVKCSKVFFDEVEKAGGIAIMGKVGHSLMKARLLQEKAVLAGEMSGHIFFKDRWYGFDDAVYSAARLIEVLSAKEKPQAVFDNMPRVKNTPEIRIDCPDEIKFQVTEKFKVQAKSVYEDIVDIDGVRFSKGDAWGLVRPSNTQPVIVLRFEARNSEALDAIRADTLQRIDEMIKRPA
ncbi:MAG TPA: phosphomannomutase/phosphoglucomutase, partial [Deltaproteobacteria bacterium]|nr:phosphomannomutase/phosphoglucomutase [Deltaproteobacteria bacterium]